MDKEKEFIKGFNVGYQLSKHDPALLAKLSKTTPDNSEYIRALQLGAKQHDREVLLDQLKQSKSKNRDMEH
jgi:predicted RNA polymerase sigma factor